jgi:hypothetical protein
VLTPSADLAGAIVEVLGENHSSTTVIASCGPHDLSDTSIFNGLHGTATVFVVIHFYGWMPHNAGFGFLDLTPATLGQIHF